MVWGLVLGYELIEGLVIGVHVGLTKGVTDLISTPACASVFTRADRRWIGNQLVELIVIGIHV
jgi:hypothetical protein